MFHIKLFKIIRHDISLSFINILDYSSICLNLYFISFPIPFYILSYFYSILCYSISILSILYYSILFYPIIFYLILCMCSSTSYDRRRRIEPWTSGAFCHLGACHPKVMRRSVSWGRGVSSSNFLLGRTMENLTFAGNSSWNKLLSLVNHRDLDQWIRGYLFEHGDFTIGVYQGFDNIILGVPENGRYIHCNTLSTRTIRIFN